MITFANHSRRADLAEFSPEVLDGLDQLARSVDYARELDSPLWDFAVEIERLLALGMTTSDLRWLAKRGYVSHAREITVLEDTNRRFEAPQQNLAFAENTCFVLTEAGLAVLARGLEPPIGRCGRRRWFVGRYANRSAVARVGGPGIATGRAPNWDSESRTFLVGEHLVKRFRVPSPNQEAVLEAFQEEGWPTSIDDPLSPSSDQPPKRRLRDTIKGLNTNQATELIRFRGDGTGQRVVWEFIPQSISAVGSAKSQPLRRAA